MSTTIQERTASEVPEFTRAVERATAHVYERVRHVIPEIEWPVHAPYIAAINELKARVGAVVLAHNYQSPEIFHGVADFTGDSLELARRAAGSRAGIIVMCGVHFMAESAKLLNPDKLVLIPDLEAGCSLASAITAEDVRLLRQRYPGVPVVAYVNTSAAVKAEADACCTSANAAEIVRALGRGRVIFLPDEYLGRWVAAQTGVDVILWRGHCEVHERFSADELRRYRRQYEGVEILAHPECAPDVLAEADFVGSTSGMIRHVAGRRPRRVVMVTECSMSDNVTVEFPAVEFIRPCALCPHMKRITLPKILHALRARMHAVEIDAATAGRARRALERMFELTSARAVSHAGR